MGDRGALPFTPSVGVRRSPFFEATIRHGATNFSVFNHMYFPGHFKSAEEGFWSLVNDAILSDVAVERQVEISGPDASRFVQLLTPRDLTSCAVGQCKYVVITSPEGGIINDPVLLRLDDDRYWLSTADADVLLWVRGVQTFAGMDVRVVEPDVSPVQLQGPKSLQIMQALFGGAVDDLKYYWLRRLDLDGMPLVVSRTGYSGERGYEIFLCDGSKGDQLWETIMEAGRPYGLQPDTTSGIRRIEAGILAYQQDMTIENNPFEIGLDRLVAVNGDFDFIGKKALKQIAFDGVHRVSCGLEIVGEPLAARNASWWPVRAAGSEIGIATSCIYSPRLKQNIALAMIVQGHSTLGSKVSVVSPAGALDAIVVQKPFFDPDKRIAKGT